MPEHNPRLADRAVIHDLMSGFLYRDLQQWNRLRTLFHPDATIHTMWFDGPAEQFIEASSRMAGRGDVTSKHIIASPVIRFNGDRAVTETNAVLITENVGLGHLVTTHARFIDRVEARHGIWRITERWSSYDYSHLESSTNDSHGLPTVDVPREYAALAQLLVAAGHPVPKACPTRGSALERTIRSDNDTWLSA